MTPLVHLGVFDSGVGGLSVLSALHAAWPAARLTYFADSRHAPYGERDVAHVLERSQRIAAGLVQNGAQALVVACNTATALAVQALRDTWPQIPIIGVEPGIKPAVAISRVRRIAVMATPATLRSERFDRLVRAHAEDCAVICQPCPGLAARIEAGRLDAPDVVELVRSFCLPLGEAGVDVVVLGCTHYPLVRSHIAAALGEGVTIVDTADAVARQVVARCAALPGPAAAAQVTLWTHADVTRLQRIATEWLPFACRVEEAPPVFA